MEESSKSRHLPTGSATPYIAIFNSQGEVIRDPESNITLGSLVTLFEYIYEEEKTDKGHLEISTKNPNLCALTELGYQQGLQLQWGYIYPDGTGYYGPIRRVIIVGQKVTFGQRGVNITIEFTDSSELLKNIPATHYDTTRGFVEYFKDLCKGIPIGIEIVDHQSKPMVVPKVAQKVTDGSEVRQQDPEFEDIVSKGTPKDPLDPKNNLQNPTTSNPNAVGVKLLEYNPETQALIQQDPENFKTVYVKDSSTQLGVIMGTSRNKYYQIKDAIGGLSNGPYFMDSRDGRLVIHNAQTTRSIVKIYDYWGGDGELLEFSVESKFVKSSTEVKSSTDIDPDDKSIDTTMVQGVTDPNQGNEDGKDIDAYVDWDDGIPRKRSRSWFGNIWEKSNPRDKTRVAQTPVPVKVDAKEDNTALLQKNSFKTLNDAKRYYTEHPQISQEEIDQYFNEQLTKWREGAKQPMDPTKGLDKIPPFRIKRKVKLFTEVRVNTVGNTFLYNRTKNRVNNTDVTTEQTQEFVNAVQSGQIDLTSADYKRPWILPGSNSTSISNRRAHGVGHRQGWALLSSVPGLKILGDPNDAVHPHQIVYEVEVIIELNGVDIIAGANSINLGNSFGNSVNESISNQVKAQAQVIGDPVLESSMNFQIQNVSDKYQGLWYSKKVVHTISDQGYICNLEFIQRTIPVSTITIQSTISKRDYAKELIEASRAASESGSYMGVTQITKEVKKQRKDRPDKTVISWIDPKTGQVVYGQTDISSGSFIVNSPHKVEYSPGEYYQDLQKNK